MKDHTCSVQYLHSRLPLVLDATIICNKEEVALIGQTIPELILPAVIFWGDFLGAPGKKLDNHRAGICCNPQLRERSQLPEWPTDFPEHFDYGARLTGFLFAMSVLFLRNNEIRCKT